MSDSGDEKKGAYADDDNLFPKPCTNKHCGNLTHYSRKPFDEGQSRYAYPARYCKLADKYGKKRNAKCVVKKWKPNHVLDNEKFWDRDIKMQKDVASLANEWNKLKRVKKSFIVLKPILSQSRAKNTNPNNEKEVQTNELVVIEDYLEGDFVKWNSNSGWVNDKYVYSPIQAFCHWTYHYSNGKYLFSDAQGLLNINTILNT